MDKQAYSVAEAATTLGISKTTLYELIKVGQITTYSIGSKTLITAQALDDFETDPKIGCILLTGSEKAFAAGADIKEMQSKGYMDAYLEDFITRNWEHLTWCRKPVIAAVSGYALGGGTELLLSTDLRLVADTARLGLPEINLGLNLMWQGLPLAVHLVGPSKAKRLVILGQREHASDLLEWGMVDEVVAEAEVLDRALAVADSYAAQPPVQAQMIKRSVNRIAGSMSEAIMHADTDQWLLGTLTEDFSEAIAAFREKRKPEFTGN